MRLKSMEFTMPSLLISAVASFVNHTLAMMVQSAPFTVRFPVMPGLRHAPYQILLWYGGRREGRVNTLDCACRHPKTKPSLL